MYNNDHTYIKKNIIFFFAGLYVTKCTESCLIKLDNTSGAPSIFLFTYVLSFSLTKTKYDLFYITWYLGGDPFYSGWPCSGRQSKIHPGKVMTTYVIHKDTLNLDG